MGAGLSSGQIEIKYIGEANLDGVA